MNENSEFINNYTMEEVHNILEDKKKKIKKSKMEYSEEDIERLVTDPEYRLGYVKGKYYTVYEVVNRIPKALLDNIWGFMMPDKKYDGYHIEKRPVPPKNIRKGNLLDKMRWNCF